MRYLVPALHDLGELLKGRRVVPVEFYAAARKSLHFVGYEGLAMIAASGLDMAAWDALAKAANLPLCVLLGGSIGPVKAYNSNGLWLKEPAAVAAEALELDRRGRLHRASSCGSDVIASATIWRRSRLCATRSANDMQLMVDFNQGLDFAEALQRCHMIDGLDLAWIEEPIVYDNLDGYVRLAAELHTPIQIGENFYGPRDLHKALQRNACDLVMPDFMRIGGVTGWLQGRCHCRSGGGADVHASLSGSRRPRDAGDGDRALARVAGLGRPDPGAAL